VRYSVVVYVRYIIVEKYIRIRDALLLQNYKNFISRIAVRKIFGILFVYIPKIEYEIAIPTLWGLAEMCG
jgi:hypothetical protein